MKLEINLAIQVLWYNLKIPKSRDYFHYLHLVVAEIFFFL